MVKGKPTSVLPPTKRTTRWYRLVPLLLLCLTVSASAQYYYGKNKVQYTPFDWQVMTTEHFRVYFYAAEASLAQTAAQIAETAYRELAARYNHEVRKHIPLIIYSSPSYFSQTNVIPGLLPESVGGFTEFMKGRVVVPFNGSYADFEHVIWHELVHAFMLSRLDDVYRHTTRTRPFHPPLWFTEGLAEYWSKDWDAKSDMVVADMVVNDRFFSIDQMYHIRGTYYMYKMGESILHFIDSTYGPDKIPLIFDNWYRAKDFEQVIEMTLGVSLQEVSRQWQYYLKKRYYPELADDGLPMMESSVLTRERFAEKGVPIRWDDGRGEEDYIVYKAYALGYTAIHMRPADTARRGHRILLRGERSSAFESLHLMRSGIDATPDGQVVFSSKSQENDVLYIYDLNEDRVTARYEFEDLVEARSPRFSPDGSRVAFAGVRQDGYTNLYQLDLKDGQYRALTDDIYLASDPCYSRDGKRIVFSSDRCAAGADGALNLFELDLESGLISQLTFGRFRDQSPECTDRGVFFSSDRAGTYNLFLLHEDGSLTQQTAYVTGAFDPRLAPDGEHLIYTGYQNMTYRVYRLKLPIDPPEVARPIASRSPAWQPIQIDRRYARSAVKYDVDYSFDIAQSTFGYDPIQGSLGGMQAAVTDMLGNRAYYLLLTNTAQTSSELLEAFNVGITYLNRERRLNWGVGGFHLYDEYYNDYDQYYFERQAGGIGLLSYPLSRFQRIDFSTIARYSDRDSRYQVNERETFLLSNYLSWIYDNSLWDISGPIDGRRYNITVGLTSSIDRGQMFNRLAMADLRHYLRLGGRSALAHRALAYTSSGREPQRIYLGGSWSFRGYPFRAFYTRNVLFSSTELRFPLIDMLLIGFPFGGFDFRGIRGALFFDTGSAWDNHFDQFLGSFGGGFRVALGYVVVLRFDFTRTTDFETISDNTDFDFFFGWNF